MARAKPRTWRASVGNLTWEHKREPPGAVGPAPAERTRADLEVLSFDARKISLIGCWPQTNTGYS